jgi:hypothetical protein
MEVAAFYLQEAMIVRRDFQVYDPALIQTADHQTDAGAASRDGCKLDRLAQRADFKKRPG